jgi:hypothetical protein
MRIVMFAVMLLGTGMLFGCSSESAALAKAKAEAEAAKADAAAAKAQADAAKTELALLKAQLAKDQSDENKVMDVGKEFIQLLRANRSDKAYELTSASFQKEMYPLGLPEAPEIRKSDPLTKKYPAILNLERIEHRQHKLKKSADGKTYEYFCHAREIRTGQATRVDPSADPPIDRTLSAGAGPWIELTLTIIDESGAWKVDKLKVDMEVP